MLYPHLRRALFALEPESAHFLSLESLKALQRVGLLGRCEPARTACARTVMGISFASPVGLAAGLDKNGAYVDALGALGFGFIEIGTVTPRPQPGNPKPRLFRLPQAGALINRLGFNNEGVDRLVENVRRSSWQGVLGINIGKNFSTPIERALDDYRTCLRKVYPLASYVTVNISSPNTQGLRDLQGADHLDTFLEGLGRERASLADRSGRYVPLALKIAPDLSIEQIGIIADLTQKHRIDAIVATNTTTDRSGVAALEHGGEPGGLSGAPLMSKSTCVLRQLVCALAGAIPVIGVGGIMSGADARAKIDAGASLVQIYTGFIYKGPGLIAECRDALCGPAVGLQPSTARG
jgi:dihydroorotate dehydrogenase